jgi:lipoprotein-releasing system permease protein
LNTELFIARKLFFSRKEKANLSSRILKIGVGGVAFGMIVMIISVAVFAGFKTEIRNKVTGFSSHIQLVNFDSNNSFESIPVESTPPFLEQVKALPNVKHIQQFATKPGILQTKEDFHGIVLNGAGADYDWKFFNKHMVEGKIPSFTKEKISNEVLISKKVASLLQLKLGDNVFAHFLDQRSSRSIPRKFTISGIYNTSLEEFDKTMVICDIRQVQRLYRWKEDQISGFEIYVNDFDKIETTSWEIRNITSKFFKENSTAYRTQSIFQKNPQIFGWLSMIDVNIWILLSLITGVVGINMISALLVLILEKTNFIGLLKSIGARNISIRKVFIYLAAFLIGRGLIWGNILGIAICLLQQQFNLIPLDPEFYYLETVPILIPPMAIVALNAACMFIIVLMLIIPSLYISKLSPEKTLRFD